MNLNQFDITLVFKNAITDLPSSPNTQVMLKYLWTRKGKNIFIFTQGYYSSEKNIWYDYSDRLIQDLNAKDKKKTNKVVAWAHDSNYLDSV